MTQICSLDPYLTDYQDTAGIYYTDDNDRALGESFGPAVPEFSADGPNAKEGKVYANAIL